MKKEDITKLPETEPHENIGKKVKFPGIPVEFEVRSELECASESVIRMASTRADCEKLMAQGVKYPEGSKGGYFCNVCGVELYLAPSGQRIQAMGGEYTCMYCVLKMKEEHN